MSDICTRSISAFVLQRTKEKIEEHACFCKAVHFPCVVKVTWLHVEHRSDSSKRNAMAKCAMYNPRLLEGCLPGTSDSISVDSIPKIAFE